MGLLISPKESQSVWGYCNVVLLRGANAVCLYTYSILQDKNVRTVGSSKMVQVKVLKITILMALLGKLKLASECPRLKDGLIHAVFIGGGTPTSLSPANSERLLKSD